MFVWLQAIHTSLCTSNSRERRIVIKSGARGSERVARKAGHETIARFALSDGTGTQYRLWRRPYNSLQHQFCPNSWKRFGQAEGRLERVVRP